jgi:di/tricarboxylate transporter
MAVGLAASAAFMTPFSHKANLLVMGAGGYTTRDYLRLGTPLTLLFLLLVVAVVPILFPLHP